MFNLALFAFWVTRLSTFDNVKVEHLQYYTLVRMLSTDFFKGEFKGEFKVFRLNLKFSV